MILLLMGSKRLLNSIKKRFPEDAGMAAAMGGSCRAMLACSWRPGAWNSTGLKGRWRKGLRLYDAGDFFRAHEEWESVWLLSQEPEKTFLQGLIQVTAAFHHLQRNNPVGAVRLFKAALAPAGPVSGGVRRSLPGTASRRTFATGSLLLSQAHRLRNLAARVSNLARAAFLTIALGRAAGSSTKTASC